MGAYRRSIRLLLDPDQSRTSLSPRRSPLFTEPVEWYRLNEWESQHDDAQMSPRASGRTSELEEAPTSQPGRGLDRCQVGPAWRGQVISRTRPLRHSHIGSDGVGHHRADQLSPGTLCRHDESSHRRDRAQQMTPEGRRSSRVTVSSPSPSSSPSWASPTPSPSQLRSGPGRSACSEPLECSDATCTR